MNKINGIVERITYVDFDSGYSVIKVKSKNYRELITVIGNMSSVNVGAVVAVTGNWISHPKFGEQFQADGWSEKIPETVVGMEKYLSGGLIKGIGPKFAKLIVNYFQEDTFDVIENYPERLLELKNIGKKRVEKISKAWKEQKESKRQSQNP